MHGQNSPMNKQSQAGLREPLGFGVGGVGIDLRRSHAQGRMLCGRSGGGIYNGSGHGLRVLFVHARFWSRSSCRNRMEMSRTNGLPLEAGISPFEDIGKPA